ncbi:MAG: acyltransferase [Bacteroidetes bacterium]|jgi:acetyltransferase-like isoleucine patch superfamily enzyme|nr:acyltransferase [Bacteroidota bacterium]MBU1579358.1 acyltransferase [Bacteroidota bacterium]MBU2466107.1 acyltransferase [Bacteroidota bacterium]MBU2556503.1 acyltransferase [Bacteroidota bacterium]MDA3943876.1 acyltransferase [Bacteroidota bacterium]
MALKERIKSNPKLKKLALWSLMPKNQARPRLWVKWFLNPLKHHRGKGSLVRRRTRMDVLPFNEFSIGRDSTIEDFATINNGVGAVHIGDRSRIGLGCVVIGPVKVGNDVMFAQNIVVSGLNHGYQDINIPPSLQAVETKPIVIEDDVWIGANAVITAGVTIGKHAVIAAGSIVTKSVPEFSIVAGNPARILKQYNHTTNTWEKLPKIN